MKQPIDSTTAQIIAAYHTSNHRLSIETGRWTTIPTLSTPNYATFAPTMQLKMRHISCWNVPYTTPLEIRFHHYLRT
jgi:hypothetical protein